MDKETLAAQFAVSLSQSRQLVNSWIDLAEDEEDEDSKAPEEDFTKILGALPSASVGLGSQAAAQEIDELSKATQYNNRSSHALSSIKRTIEKRKRVDSNNSSNEQNGDNKQHLAKKGKISKQQQSPNDNELSDDDDDDHSKLSITKSSKKSRHMSLLDVYKAKQKKK